MATIALDLVHLILWNSFCFSLSAPSTSFLRSSNVSVSEINRTTLTIQFKPPALLERNGKIRKYNVRYFRQSTGGLANLSVLQVNVSSDANDQNRIVSARLEGLKESSVYQISVQACGELLCSDYEPAVIAQTLASGK